MSVRVKIVLSKIFNDYRKEAFILLKDDQSFQYVRDFEMHIQKVFNIQFGIYLTIGDSLLPSWEHISVIHSGDTIIINKLNEKVDDVTINELNKQSTDNQSNDEKCLVKRGKRIRKRKKKQVDEKDSPDTISNNKAYEEAFIVHCRSTNSTNSHIRFSDDSTTSDSPSFTNEVMPSKCVDVLQARVIRPVTVLSVACADILHSDTPTLNKSICSENIVALIDLANNSNFAEIAASIDFAQITKNIDDSVDFVSLKEEPKVYDLIAFKMIKIGKNYEPQLSEWIIAMVKDVEELHVVVHILAGAEETSCPDGKFSLSTTICEQNESSAIKTLKREDLLNIKVFYNN